MEGLYVVAVHVVVVSLVVPVGLVLLAVRALKALIAAKTDHWMTPPRVTSP